MYEDFRKSLEHLGRVLTNQQIKTYNIDQEDYDILDHIWWELEKVSPEDPSKRITEECQDKLLIVLSKMDRQGDT